MIVLKRFELKKTGAQENNIDSYIETKLKTFYSGISHYSKMANKRTLIALAQYITYHVLFYTRRIYVEIKHRTLLNPHGKRMIDAVRGRGEIKNHGASFYLRRISDR